MHGRLMDVYTSVISSTMYDVSTASQCPVTYCTRSHLVPCSAMYSPSNTSSVRIKPTSCHKTCFPPTPLLGEDVISTRGNGLPSTVDACSRVQRDRSFTHWRTLMLAMKRVLVTSVTRDQPSRRIRRMWPVHSSPSCFLQPLRHPTRQLTALRRFTHSGSSVPRSNQRFWPLPAARLSASLSC